MVVTSIAWKCPCLGTFSRKFSLGFAIRRVFPTSAIVVVFPIGQKFAYPPNRKNYALIDSPPPGLN